MRLLQDENFGMKTASKETKGLIIAIICILGAALIICILFAGRKIFNLYKTKNENSRSSSTLKRQGSMTPYNRGDPRRNSEVD